MDRKRQQLVVLMAAMFIYTMGFGIIMPITPFYTKSLGASALDLGLLMASYSAMQFLFAPAWGRLSDRLGRKPVLIAGLIGLGGSFVLFGLATSLWLLFVARILGGAVSAGIFPASLAYIADVTSSKERGKMMGMLGAASGLGIIFGPAISSIIALGGLSLPFFVAGALAAGTGLVAILLLPESLKQRREKTTPGSPVKSVGRFFGSLTSPLKTYLGAFFILTMVITFAIAGFESTFTYYTMDRYGISDQIGAMPVLWTTISITGPMVTALVFVIMGVVGVICQGFLVNEVINRIAEERTIIAGLLFCASGLFLFIFAGDLAVLLLASGVYSIGSGLVTPSLNTLVSRRTPPDRQGAVMGVLGSYNSLGRITGPAFGGFLYSLYMYLPYLFSGSIAVLGAIWVYVVSRVAGKEEKAQVPPLQR